MVDSSGMGGSGVTTSGTVVLVMILATAFLVVVFRVFFRVVLAMVGPFIPALIYADSRWRGHLQSVIHYAYIISNEEYVRNPFQMFFEKRPAPKKLPTLETAWRQMSDLGSPCESMSVALQKRSIGKSQKELRLGSSKF